MNEMRIYFPGGKKVYADYKGFTHKTDQPVHAGGEGSASSPFELFLASMGTCAGFYVLVFCQGRGIDTEGIELIQRLEFDPETRALAKVNLEIKLPPTFPEKYKSAVINSAGMCAVKKSIEKPPQFNITTS